MYEAFDICWISTKKNKFQATALVFKRLSQLVLHPVHDLLSETKLNQIISN